MTQKIFGHDYNDKGIDVSKLAPGTTLIVQTQNSKYKLKKTGYGLEMIAQGGSHLLEPTEAHFTGSTWGGSAIRIGWIGHQMHLELHFKRGNKRRKLLTTSVLNAKIITDTYEYDMGWDAEEDI